MNIEITYVAENSPFPYRASIKVGADHVSHYDATPEGAAAGVIKEVVETTERRLFEEVR